MRNIVNLLAFIIVSFLVLTIVACDPDDPQGGENCELCQNGECVDMVCNCDQFWTGINCDTVMPPTKMIITNLFTDGVEPMGAIGPWDSAPGQEAPDLVYYIYDGFYFDKSQFQNLPHLYKSDVFENYTSAEFGVSDVNVELNFGERKTITILLADNDPPGTAFSSDFMELAYLDFPFEWDTIPPYIKEQTAFGTLQFPFNIQLSLEYE
mgnify:CR=1 FL=1